MKLNWYVYSRIFIFKVKHTYLNNYNYLYLNLIINMMKLERIIAAGKKTYKIVPWMRKIMYAS